MHRQTIHGARAVSTVGLDGPFVQEAVKSVASVVKHAKSKSGPESNSADNDEEVNELIESDSAAIKSIISQISSWMDMKRQRELTKNQAKYFDERPQTRHRPFVTIAYAQTLDGMIAAKVASKDTERPETTSNLQLSCPQSTILTHRLRNMHDAILVGGSTFLVDAPRLNVRLSSNIMKESLIEQPTPVVLDTNLKSLEKLLWGKIISVSNEEGEEVKDDEMPEDMYPENIRACNPVICCSSDAARLFLDHLELFQQQQKPIKKVEPFPGQLNKQQKRLYKITVYKMVDEENDHEDDLFLPIKITVQVTLDGNKQKEVAGQSDVTTTTFTLLPCQLDKNEKALDLQYVLQQLYRQFQIDSVMVEGGSGVLSSFFDEFVSANKNKKSGDKRLVDCICATISPSVIGMGGLPVLKHLDAVAPMQIKDGRFCTLGRDCTFLGRV